MENMVKAWLIYSKTDYNRNYFFANEIINKGKSYDIEFKLLYSDDIEFGNNENGLFIKYMGTECSLPAFAIVRTIYPKLNRHLEYMGIAVYNNSSISRVCNDKALTLQLMASNNILTVPTIYIRKEDITEKIIAEHDGYVIKTVNGHGGKQVFLINKQNDNYHDVYFHVKNNDVVIQPFINSNGRDLRVYILDGHIKTAILRISNSGFKSNFTLGGSAQIYNLSTTQEDIINHICEVFIKENMNKNHGLVLAGIDFIIDENDRLLLSEIEDVVGCRMIYELTEIDIVKEYISIISNWQ